jgi:hypothetical protein
LLHQQLFSFLRSNQAVAYWVEYLKAEITKAKMFKDKRIVIGKAQM